MVEHEARHLEQEVFEAREEQTQLRSQGYVTALSAILARRRIQEARG